MAAIVRALQHMNPCPFAFSQISLQAEPFASLKGQPTEVFDSTLRSVVEALPPKQRKPDLLVTLAGGNEHTIFGLLEPPKGPIDFVFGGVPCLPTGQNVELLPEKKVTTQLDARHGRNKAFLRQFRALFDCTMVQVQSPPPVLSNEYILQHLDPYFRENFKNPVVAAPALRLKLWLLSSKLIREFCEASGIGFLESPAVSQTPDGFLQTQFNWRNATHANEQYGALVVQQISEILDAKLAGPAIARAKVSDAEASAKVAGDRLDDPFWAKMDDMVAVICDEEALDIEEPAAAKSPESDAPVRD